MYIIMVSLGRSTTVTYLNFAIGTTGKVTLRKETLKDQSDPVSQRRSLRLRKSTKKINLWENDDSDSDEVQS